ncbi:4Fe-4S binding protein [Paraclostridium benzoelyticum]
MNCFVISDPNKCIGCRTCSIACVVAHSEENIFLHIQII